MAVPIEIDVWQGEIAELEVDAIIVPANESLFMTNPARPALATLPLSARDVFRTIEDPGGNAEQEIVDSDPSGAGRNRALGHRLALDRLAGAPLDRLGQRVGHEQALIGRHDDRVDLEFGNLPLPHVDLDRYGHVRSLDASWPVRRFTLPGEAGGAGRGGRS